MTHDVQEWKIRCLESTVARLAEYAVESRQESKKAFDDALQNGTTLAVSVGTAQGALEHVRSIANELRVLVDCLRSDDETEAAR
jgi:hypothetical protein